MSFVGWIIILIGLLFSIGLHEIGHLVPAKKFGVKVSQYMIGFGPTMWSKKVGDTEYGIKWILLGGYIRMVGMISPNRSPGLRGRDVSAPAAPTTWWGRVAEDTRAASAEDIDPADADRVFYKLSAPRKLIVMMGGPTMNFLLAIVFFGIATCGISVQTVNTTIGAVSKCSAPSADGSCAADAPAAPSSVAGLQPGDTVLSFAGTEVTTNPELRDAIAKNGGQATEIVVNRGGESRSLAIAPELVTNADGTTRGFIGVTFGVSAAREPISALPGKVWEVFSGTVGAVVRLPQLTYNAAASLFSDKPRDQNSALGIVGIGRLAGDAMSVDSPSVGVPEKAAFVLSILGSLNMALFVFNLIPLLPLDGGHAAGAIWEGLRRTIARFRRTSDPGPVDLAKTMPLAYAMFALLTVVGIVIIAADILKPIGLS